MSLTQSVKIATFAAALIAGSPAIAKDLPSYGHYLAYANVTADTPSPTSATCPAVGTSPFGAVPFAQFSLNTVDNIPARLLRYVVTNTDGSLSVYRDSYNHKGEIKRSIDGATATVVGSYTATLVDYDPNSFGGTITQTVPSSDGSGTCAETLAVAFVRSSAD
jgi:hypothetical protein